MSMIDFLPQDAKDPSCPKPTLPQIFQRDLSIAEGTGDAPEDLLEAQLSGLPAAMSGGGINDGCMALQLDVSYVVDSNSCSDCPTTSSEVTVEVATYFVRPKQKFVIPPGYVSQIQVTTGDYTNNIFTPTPVPNGQTQDVIWEGCGNNCSCNGPVLVP